MTRVIVIAVVVDVVAAVSRRNGRGGRDGGPPHTETARSAEDRGGNVLPNDCNADHSCSDDSLQLTSLPMHERQQQ